jgi:capsular exopolysaccharide synthesis family protein
VEDTDPNRAANIANMLIEVLIRQNESMQASRFSSSEESLSSQIEAVQNQITSLQSEIATVSEENLKSQLSNVEGQISSLQGEIVDLQITIRELEVREETNNQQPTPTLDAKTLSQVQQYRLDLQEKQGLLNLYQELYFNLVSSDSNGNLIGSGILGSNSQYQSTLALYQQIYANLLSDYEAVRLSRLENTTALVSVEPATPNTKPIRPQPMINTLLGAVVGLMIASGTVFLAEYLDDTVKSPEEIGRFSSLPIIGYLPRIQLSGMNGKGNSVIYVQENPRSPIAEAYRSLRTNIEFSGVAHHLKTILVTSPGPQEGKSTTAVNLASILVQGGKKVVLLDADLRRPYVHRYFKFQNRLGLSEYFRGEIELENTFNYVDPTRRLITIPSGKLPPNPAELLGSERMSIVLEQLNLIADYVLIDSPPLVVTDPVILSSKVDGVILVVQPGMTHLSAVRASIDQLEHAQARILGIVMNNITKQTAYYYQNYYANYYQQSTYYTEEEERVQKVK